MRGIIMAQALTTVPAAPIIPSTTSSSVSPKASNPATPPASLTFRPTLACQRASAGVHRRNIISLGIAGAVWGLNWGEEEAAWAAARRPPPLPPGEKKDPNISGVQAKVLASKKRKEAMKQAMTKQREMGKKIEP